MTPTLDPDHYWRYEHEGKVIRFRCETISGWYVTEEGKPLARNWTDAKAAAQRLVEKGKK